MSRTIANIVKFARRQQNIAKAKESTNPTNLNTLSDICYLR